MQTLTAWLKDAQGKRIQTVELQCDGAGRLLVDSTAAAGPSAEVESLVFVPADTAVVISAANSVRRSLHISVRADIPGDATRDDNYRVCLSFGGIASGDSPHVMYHTDQCLIAGPTLSLAQVQAYSAKYDTWLHVREVFA